MGHLDGGPTRHYVNKKSNENPTEQTSVYRRSVADETYFKFSLKVQNLPHMRSFNRLTGVGGLAPIQVTGWVVLACKIRHSMRHITKLALHTWHATMLLLSAK